MRKRVLVFRMRREKMAGVNLREENWEIVFGAVEPNVFSKLFRDSARYIGNGIVYTV